MVRLNLMLLLTVVLSAFYLVHTQYESRRLYTQIDKARAQVRRLEADHEHLQVQKQAQATSARVQFIASRQLQMRPANPAITHYVTYAGAVPSVGGAAERRLEAESADDITHQSVQGKPSAAAGVIR
ncbi:MAG: cell division protein FtsL [Burkholderiales bacterium]|nr:cell division protein FtsL [Burkholderiales bacterium]